MSKTKLGDLLADCGKQPGSDKRAYVKVGIAFRDNTNGSVSIKIDALPLPGVGWSGWCNVFETREGDRPVKAKGVGQYDGQDDNIPF